MIESTLSAIEDRLEYLNKHRLPAVITPDGNERLVDLLGCAREELGEVLARHGAILFRGFGLRTAEEFHQASSTLFGNGMHDYAGGASPRGQVRSGVFESTRVPAPFCIPQHHEMSYMPDPPRRLAFFCETAPREGGETPLADSRKIYGLIPEEVRAEFEAKGIRYHRYLYGPRWNLHHRTRNRFIRLYTSWMHTFSTTDRRVVEEYWAAHGGSVQWDREGGARIASRLRATRPHPETGEMLWFNHVAVFLSSPRSTGWLPWLGYHLAYPNPLRRPFHAEFGDGTPIRHAQIDAIRGAIDAATVKFHWWRGDLLLVDNFLVTHGRRPFRGPRKILVAISAS